MLPVLASSGLPPQDHHNLEDIAQTCGSGLTREEAGTGTEGTEWFADSAIRWCWQLGQQALQPITPLSANLLVARHRHWRYASACHAFQGAFAVHQQVQRHAHRQVAADGRVDEIRPQRSASSSGVR